MKKNIYVIKKIKRMKYLKKFNESTTYSNEKSIDTIFYTSIKSKDFNSVKHCIENGLDPNMDNGTALRLVISTFKEDSLPLVKLLVQKGSDVSLRRNMALKISIEYGCLQVTKFLLENINKNKLNIEYLKSWANSANLDEYQLEEMLSIIDGLTIQ